MMVNKSIKFYSVLYKVLASQALFTLAPLPSTHMLLSFEKSRKMSLTSFPSLYYYFLTMLEVNLGLPTHREHLAPD